MKQANVAEIPEGTIDEDVISQGIQCTDEDNNLWVLLSQTRDAMYKAREKELSKFGVSTMQAAAMLVIKQAKGPVTPSEISRWLFREPHSVSGMLSRMESDGLIKKTKDLGKKNLVRVTLTKKGIIAYTKSKELEPIHRIFSSLSDEQRGNLKSSLSVLLEKSLEELRTKPKFVPWYHR
ncbi:MarR family winged helix-turn-helix transcriptional regulator [Chloroflexota bacterium]